MEILNETPFEHSLAIGLGPDREPHLGVLLKGTFTIPRALDGVPEVAADQVAIATGDEHYRGDVTGSVESESDAVVFKPRADVVLSGTAYAPDGTPTTQVDAGLRVGRTEMVVRVFGERRWVFPTRLAVVPLVSAAEPFVAMPLVYERSFGGFDRKGKAWCAKNYIGRGFIGAKTRESVDGRRLPNIEDPRHLIRSWDDHPDPVGFGFYGKSWEPRAALTGVDVDHLDPDFGLPADFDHAFFNGAHPALQVPGYLSGDEPVDLLNVTPDGRRRFRLPGVRPRMTLHTHPPASPAAEEALEEPPTEAFALAPVLDTLVFLPDADVFTLVWRASVPVGRDVEAAVARIARLHLEAAFHDPHDSPDEDGDRSA